MSENIPKCGQKLQAVRGGIYGQYSFWMLHGPFPIIATGLRAHHTTILQYDISHEKSQLTSIFN